MSCSRSFKESHVLTSFQRDLLGRMHVSNWNNPYHGLLHCTMPYNITQHHTIPYQLPYNTALHLTAPYQLPFTTQHHVNVMFEFGADAGVAEAPLCRADLICTICCTGISWPNLVQPERSPEICSSHINDVKLFSIVIASHWEREEAILL